MAAQAPPPAPALVGLSSFAFGWALGVDDRDERMSAEALVDVAAGLGVDVLQVADNVGLTTLPAGERRALARRAERARLVLEAGARGLVDAELDAQLEVCADLGARLLRVVIDAPGHEPSPDAVVALLRRRIGDLEQAGVTVALENHDRLSARVLVDIVRRCDSPLVGVCLDTANSLGHGEGLEHVVDVLAEQAVCVHVKDFVIRRRRHGMGFVVEGAALGEGMLDLPALLRAVATTGRCRSALLELWTPEQSSYAATLRLEHEWARAGVRTLADAVRSVWNHPGGQPR